MIILDSIKKYLSEECHEPSMRVASTLQDLSAEDDIAAEYIKWIEARNYDYDGQVEIEGFTAKSLHERRPDLPPNDIFYLLIRLRHFPDQAKKIIELGKMRM